MIRLKGVEKAKLKANLKEEELVSKLEVALGASTSHRMSSGGADAEDHASTDVCTILLQHVSSKVVVSASYMW